METTPTIEPTPPAPEPPAAPPAAAPPADYSRPFFWMLLLSIAVGIGHFLTPPQAVKDRKPPQEDGDFWSNIAGRFGPGITVIKMYGTISMPDKESYYGGEGAQDIADVLHKLRKRDDIKGVVLRVNSPGGSVGASQEIFDEIKALKNEHHKKIVVSMGDMAASGGYYVSAPANFIFVNPGTITGSIGVITQAAIARELIDKIGIQFHVFKSGAFKDMGSFARPLTSEEKDVFQGIVMGAYDQFVKAVTEGRCIDKEADGRKVVLKSEEDVRKLADGRIYLGSQAVKNGLADAEGNLFDAISKCGELAGLGKDPTLINVRTGSPIPDIARFLRGEAESSTPALAKMAEQLVSHASVPVMYLYQP
ncbi:MAG: signal peptide peptidase SppA [Candidatus Wallbacteria bacterium]|nr:signal peptide peptidase SppA [Candidatus Wallbacteria bacterium]